MVGSRALTHVLQREHAEDLHRLAGIARETDQAIEALESPPLRRLRHRMPWRRVSLAGSALATFVISRYGASLESRPEIAVFVPGLM